MSAREWALRINRVYGEVNPEGSYWLDTKVNPSDSGKVIFIVKTDEVSEPPPE